MEYERPYFIFVGRLEDNVKNVSLLIHAFAKAKKENYQLRIYGDGNDKPKLQRLVKELDMHRDILFFPFQENISAEIAAARALLLTSHYEGFPRALIEALGVGAPVISVDCKSGPEEIVIDKDNGLLVENHNEIAFTKAVESFIFDEELYAYCKSNAKASVSHLQMETIAEQWGNYIHQL